MKLWVEKWVIGIYLRYVDDKLVFKCDWNEGVFFVWVDNCLNLLIDLGEI